MIPTQNLPHALLVPGNPLEILPELLIDLKQLLCKNEASEALFESEAGHPDLMIIRPEGKLNITKIDQVREVIGFLEQTAMRGGMRIVVFTEADTLNIAAQNALLKSLEEPGTKTLLILLTAKPHLLLPTIKSRCQVLQTASHSKHQDQTLMSALLKTPFNPLSFIETHKELDPLACVHAQMQIIHHKMETQPQTRLAHFYDTLLEKSEIFQKRVAINAELALFDLSLAWRRFFADNVTL